MSVTHIIQLLQRGLLSVEDAASSGILADAQLHDFALQCVEEALSQRRDEGHIVPRKFTRLLAVKRAWLNGECSDEALEAAREEAEQPDFLSVLESSSLGQFAAGLGQLFRAASPGQGLRALRQLATPSTGALSATLLEQLIRSSLYTDAQAVLAEIVTGLAGLASFRGALQQAGQAITAPAALLERLLARDDLFSQLRRLFDGQAEDDLDRWFTDLALQEERRLALKLGDYIEALQASRGDLLTALTKRQEKLNEALRRWQVGMEEALF